MTTTYKIIRHYQRAGLRNETIRTGLTLDEAQAHCQDPETASDTCKGTEGRKRTEQVGVWFDAFTAEGGQ